MRYLFLLILAACTSTEVPHVEKQSYAMPFAKVWAATRTSLVEGGLNIYEEDKDKGVMRAATQKKLLSKGDTLLITFIKKSENETEIVISRLGIPIKWDFVRDSNPEIHDSIQNKLKTSP